MRRTMLFRCVWFALIAGLWFPRAALPAGSPVSQFSTNGRNIYRLASAELDRSAAAREIVGSTYDGRVCAFDSGGRHLWDAETGGFVFDLAAGDLDGDGRDEILAACADGFVYAINHQGRQLWKQDLGAPVWQVATAKSPGKTRVALAGGVSRKVVAFAADGKRLGETNKWAINGAVRVMRAGDFDGDGKDEIAVLPVRGQAKDLVFLDLAGLKRRKESISSEVVPWDASADETKKMGKQFRSGKRRWTGQSLKSANGCTADLDNDGAVELLFNPGAYSLKGGLRQTAEFPESFKAESYDRFYKMRLIAAGDLTASPGAEVVVLEGNEIRLLDRRGKTLGTGEAPFGFTDVVYVPGKPRGYVLLGSSPNGDDNIYGLRFDNGWEQALAGLSRQGFMAGVERDLGRLSRDLKKWKGEPLEGASAPYDVVVEHHMWSGADLKKLDPWIATVKDYEKQFPYSNLRFSTCFWPGEDAPLLRPDGKPWGRDMRLAHDLKREVIVAGAKKLEAAGCHFWVQVGHGCDPHCEVATVAAIYEAAPKTCLGCVSAEDEQIDAVPYYFEHHIRPILELCLKSGKRFIPRNKDVWWLHWPADPRLRESIFNGRYRSVLLPSVEDSNSRTSHAQLAARVGLWLDGQVDDWCSRICADWFCASRSWEWEYVMTGHPHLRYLTSQAALGARVFMFLGGERTRRGGEWTNVGREGAANFLHLLGKGVLVPPRREQLRAVSPVTVVVQHPSKRFAEHGANGHHPENWSEDGTDSKAWAFDRLDCYWAMAPLPATDLSTLFWGRRSRGSENIAVTAPYGFVCVLPGSQPQSKERWQSIWTTDGDQLTRDGKALSLTNAGELLKRELVAGAAEFPLQVEGQVFQQVIQHSPNRFVVVLMDPGWLDPAEREVTIRGSQGQWKVNDRLTGDALGDLSQPLTVQVPAGVFRLLDARRD